MGEQRLAEFAAADLGHAFGRRRTRARSALADGRDPAALEINAGLALWQAHPEVVINRRNRGALPNRGHGTDQNALYLRFTERCKESAERAAWRLRRHRSSGDLEKKTACCSNSSSSRPRAPRNRRRMRRTRARLVRLAVARFINSTLAQRPPRHNPDSCQKNLACARLPDTVPPWHQRR